MADVAFPSGLRPQSVLFHLQNVSRSGGPGSNGMEQVVASLAGRWRATLRFAVTARADILALRAFVGALGGRALTTLVPVYDGKRVNWPVDAYGRTLHPGFTRRPELDGTDYEDPEIPDDSAVNATANAGAALQAIALGIAMTQGAPLAAGQYFSVGERLHLITAISAVAGAVTTVAFQPGLRAAVSGGAAVVLTRPACLMRLASDDDGELALELARFGSVTLNFVEAF